MKEMLYLFFFLSPILDDVSGMFLSSGKSLSLNFFLSTGKSFYKACVLVFNKKMLDKRVDTPWRDVLKMCDADKPEWRSLYKPPLSKRVGDIQWRLLHGALAVNAFISVLNSDVTVECPFCLKRETVFHAYMDCFRLKSLFSLLHNLFDSFNESFSIDVFIVGFRYVRRKRFICQCLNFIIGQAKLAIYMSRKNKIELGVDQDINTLFLATVKSRILIDFHFYASMDDIITFQMKWCKNDALCSIIDGKIFFSLLLM